MSTTSDHSILSQEQAEQFIRRAVIHLGLVRHISEVIDELRQRGISVAAAEVYRTRMKMEFEELEREQQGRGVRCGQAPA